MSTSTSSAPRHVYHLSWPRLLPIPLIGLAVLVMFTLTLFPGAGGWAQWKLYLIVLAGVMVFFGAFFLITWQSRLVLTPEGIAHHQFGYTIRTTWENVQFITMGRGVQGLILRQPGTHSRLLRGSLAVMDTTMPGLSGGLVGHPRELAQGRLILLAPFMYHWKKGPLREDLRRWAPQLFDDQGELKALYP